MPPELPRPEPNPSPRPGPIQGRPGEAPFYHHSPSSPVNHGEVEDHGLHDVEEEEAADDSVYEEVEAAPEAPAHAGYSTEDDYLDDPVLEPRMALAPHMERPSAPADPVPPGYYPPGSTYPPTSQQRRRRRGTARKTAITEELLEAQSAVLSHEGGAHWQKTRRRRDAFIISFVVLAVTAVLVIIFLPDKYFGVKQAPVTSTEDSGEESGGPRRQLDPYVSSADILAERDRERAAAAAATTEGPLDPESALLRSDEELTPEQRQAIVDRALREAADFRAQLDQELKELESTVDPNADPELPPDALAPPRELSDPPVTPTPPLKDPGAAVSPTPPPVKPAPETSATLDSPAPRSEFRPRRKSQAEIDAEVDAQMKATMNQLIQEKKIAPPPVPVEEPVPGVPRAGAIPRAVPVEPQP